MSIEQHKMALSCYRPGKDDPTQPELAEALTALKTDPELAAWYDAESAFDASFRESLGESPAPPLSNLLIAPPSRTHWSRIAAAAAIALLIGGAAFHVLNGGGAGGMHSGSPDVAWHEHEDFRLAMAAYAASGSIGLDHMSSDLSSLQELMAGQGALTGDRLAEAFAAAHPMGCKFFQWQERSVSLYCFITDRGQIIHAFLLPRTEVSSEVLGKLTKRKTLFDRQTGGWSDQDTVYLLVAATPEGRIRPFLQDDLARLPGAYLLARHQL